MEETRLLRQLKDQMIIFLDELTEQFPEESEFPLIKFVIQEAIPTKEVMGRFVKEVLPDRDTIIAKSIWFFENDYIVGYEDWDKVSKVFCQIKRLYNTGMDEDDQDVCWSWIRFFSELAEKYYINFGEVRGWEVNHDHPVFKELDQKRADLGYT